MLTYTEHSTKRTHRPSKTPDRLTMAGVEVWHRSAEGWPDAGEVIEAETWVHDYLITGGTVAPVQVRKWIRTPRMHVKDRNLVGYWVDVTHTVPDISTHETVVAWIVEREGLGEEVVVAA